MSIPEAMNSLSSAIKTAGQIKEMSKNINNTDFKYLLANLFSELADIKLNLIDFMEEDVQLRAEIAKFHQFFNRNINC